MHKPDIYITGIAKAILETYQEVVEKQWKLAKTPIIYDKSLGENVIDSKISHMGKLSAEYRDWDKLCDEFLI
jgi:hypothetical protein